MLRPATPLTILLLGAFGLLIISIVSTPIIKIIPLASFAGIDFGVFGFCKGDACSPIELGYDTSSLLNDAQSSTFDLPSSTRATLSIILIVHPIAAFLTFIMLVLAASAHFHAPSHSPRFLLVIFIFSILTLVTALLSFLIDVLLFVPHMAWGSYLVLAATILVAMSGIVSCAMRRTLVNRKARKRRIAENAEMNGANFYGREGPNPNLPPAVIATAAAAGTAVNNQPAFATFEIAKKPKDEPLNNDERVPLTQQIPAERPTDGQSVTGSTLKYNLSNRSDLRTQVPTENNSYRAPDSTYDINGLRPSDPYFSNQFNEYPPTVNEQRGQPPQNNMRGGPRGGLRVAYDGQGRGDYGLSTRGTQQPRGGMQQPRGGMQQPRGGMQQPRGGMQQPRGGMQQPRGGMQQARGGIQQPQGAYRPPQSGNIPYRGVNLGSQRGNSTRGSINGRGGRIQPGFEAIPPRFRGDEQLPPDPYERAPLSPTGFREIGYNAPSPSVYSTYNPRLSAGTFPVAQTPPPLSELDENLVMVRPERTNGGNQPSKLNNNLFTNKAMSNNHDTGPSQVRDHQQLGYTENRAADYNMEEPYVAPLQPRKQNGSPNHSRDVLTANFPVDLVTNRKFIGNNRYDDADHVFLPPPNISAPFAPRPTKAIPGILTGFNIERDKSNEDLRFSPCSPAESEYSNFTSVSQRGVNPQWNGDTSGELKDPNYSRDLVPSRKPTQQRNDVLLSGNPDFSIPTARGGRNNARGDAMR
ncbi:BgTH12-04502 [Blumeria graminis f. sp. triticale]|uniref:BgTH12-04502 n=1 Tax=Blumeria graminis f. sp. triticale TaxID=1689686 RepID=A0A9W4CUQ3_BLUGR|nr:BgTH12-04502 [Blumeria graminis f. sp. triticale]